jgi:fibronectin type III domain protein
MTRWISMILVGLMMLWGQSAQAFKTDALVYLPPTAGTWAYNTFKPGAPGFPGLGGSYIDPIFGGTVVTRLTAHPGVAGKEQLYSRNGFHNANGTKMFQWDSSGTNIINSRTGVVLNTGILTGLANFEISWDPVDSDVYYRFEGVNLVSRKVSTGVDTQVNSNGKFSSALQSTGGTTDFITSDGRYFALRWGGIGRVYDKQTDTIFTGSIAGVGTVITSGGWFGITPNGSHLVLQGVSGSYPHHEHFSYAINKATATVTTTGVNFLGLLGDHGDLISASNGTSYEVKFNADADPPGVYLWDLNDNLGAVSRGLSGEQQVAAAARKLVGTSNYNDPDGHLSCVSKGTFQNWCFWSSELTDAGVDDFDSNPVGNWANYREEIIGMNVLTGEVRRFAHHRSRENTGANYFSNPRVCVSWDGSVVAWTSNMNISSPSNYADLYALINPLGGAPPDTTPPTPPTNFRITAFGSKQVELAWDASIDDTEVTGYLLEHCAGAGCVNFVQVGTPSGTTFSDTGMLTNTSYTFRVRATDAVSNLSTYSSSATQTTDTVKYHPTLNMRRVLGDIRAWWQRVFTVSPLLTVATNQGGAR